MAISVEPFFHAQECCVFWGLPFSAIDCKWQYQYSARSAVKRTTSRASKDGPCAGAVRQWSGKRATPWLTLRVRLGLCRTTLLGASGTLVHLSPGPVITPNENPAVPPPPLSAGSQCNSWTGPQPSCSAPLGGSYSSCVQICCLSRMTTSCVPRPWWQLRPHDAMHLRHSLASLLTSPSGFLQALSPLL